MKINYVLFKGGIRKELSTDFDQFVAWLRDQLNSGPKVLKSYVHFGFLHHRLPISIFEFFEITEKIKSKRYNIGEGVDDFLLFTVEETIDNINIFITFRSQKPKKIIGCS